MLCWIAAPTMFAAIALSVVSLNDTGLSPSIAFTALAIFQRLEAILSLIPVFVTDFVDASVSVGRIEDFLASPEYMDVSIDSDVITFQNTSIAWPLDAEIPGRFILRNLNLSFPRHELSVIAGSTGAGKSLMLAAIVGEADIIHGNVRRPRRDLEVHGQNAGPYSKDWIVPKSMALVAQTPWIENATIKDNVLFGLPFCESRYWLVLQACALLQDMETMDEGDLTEIGSHGINLSGGQRSRLSLARALYSRAETLVLDDIFSAVDAHVGRHLLEHALTGLLTEGRTCILATHHVKLCLSKAQYFVVLSNRSVVYAGPPGEYSFGDGDSANGGMDDLEQPAAESDFTYRALDISSSEASRSQTRSSTVASLHESIVELEIQERNVQLEDKPKKLVEDEQYQRGRIKSSVYKEYVRATSNWPYSFWATAFGIFVG